jgi:hypothetical protein
LLIEEEQKYYTESCNKILDESMLRIRDIEHNYMDHVQAKEIAKTFAFDYKYSFNKRHEYNEHLELVKKVYFAIVNQLF